MNPEELMRFIQSGLEHPTFSREELLHFALEVVETNLRDIGRCLAAKKYYAAAARRKEEVEAAKRRGAEARRARALRDPQILAARQAGETLQAIAERFGLTREAVRCAVERTERKVSRRIPHQRSHLAQPIDPGGPRDVWLTFVPSPDSWFDFMQPSDGS